MKTLALLFAFLGLITGLIAAWYWYRSSKVAIVPKRWIEGGRNVPSVVEWVPEAADAWEEVSRLNKWASRLTAVTAVLGALSTFLGAW